MGDDPTTIDDVISAAKKGTDTQTIVGVGCGKCSTRYSGGVPYVNFCEKDSDKVLNSVLVYYKDEGCQKFDTINGKVSFKLGLENASIENDSYPTEDLIKCSKEE